MIINNMLWILIWITVNTNFDQWLINDWLIKRPTTLLQYGWLRQPRAPEVSDNWTSFGHLWPLTKHFKWWFKTEDYQWRLIRIFARHTIRKDTLEVSSGRPEGRPGISDLPLQIRYQIHSDTANFTRIMNNK